MKAVTAAVFFITTMYATLRYNLVKGVPWSDWPGYVLNKSIALSALVFIALAVFRGARSADEGLALIRTAGLFAGVHVLLSLILLSPDSYPNLYQDGKLTGPAQWALMLGAVISVTFSRVGPTFAASRSRKVLRTLVFLTFLTGVHAALQGYRGWFTPHLWPGNLPPITLIAVVVAVSVLAVNRIRSKDP